MAWPFKLLTLSKPTAWLVLAVVILAAVAPKLCAADETYVVVVSPDVPYSNIEIDELRRIYQFKQRFWHAGQPLNLLYSEEDLVSGSFLLDRIYRTNYGGVKKLILQNLYSGEIGLAPKVVATNETAVTFVASGRGLIAVVRADAVGDEPVKVLTVGGRAPDAADYPLRR